MWSLAASAVLLSLVALQLVNLSSPVALGTLAWSVLWMAHGILGHGFTQSRSALTLVFVANLLFFFGGVAATGPEAKRCKRLSDEVIAGRRRQLAQGLQVRDRVILSLFFFGLGFLDYGMRQMGSGGLLGLASGGQQQFFETLRVGKANLTQGDEWAVPSGIKLSTAAVCAMATLIGFNLAARIESGRRSRLTSRHCWDDGHSGYRPKCWHGSSRINCRRCLSGGWRHPVCGVVCQWRPQRSVFEMGHTIDRYRARILGMGCSGAVGSAARHALPQRGRDVEPPTAVVRWVSTCVKQLVRRFLLYIDARVGVGPRSCCGVPARVDIRGWLLPKSRLCDDRGWCVFKRHDDIQSSLE